MEAVAERIGGAVSVVDAAVTRDVAVVGDNSIQKEKA